MKKAELLADLQSKVLKVVSTVEEQDTAKNEANVRQYLSNVMQQNGDTVVGRNVGWYTIDEGTANEQAFYRDTVIPKSVARDAVIAYLKGLSPATFLRFTVETVDEANLYAIATALKVTSPTTVKQVRVVVFKNGASPISHAEIE